MNTLTERQKATLTLIGDTFAPALKVDGDHTGFYARAASDLGVAERMEAVLSRYAEPDLLKRLLWVLDLFESPFFNLLMAGIRKPFAEMTLQERTQTLLAWSESMLPAKRQLFQALKRLALFQFYSIPDASGVNPNWQVLDYNLPPPAPSAEKPIIPLTITTNRILETDVVIVGSGAGGSVVAAELAQAGLGVMVVEKGGYYAETDFDGYEDRSLEKMFDHGGYLVSHDLSISILAGSTLGGGTTINWCASLPTPDHVLHEWEQDFALPGLMPVFKAALEGVMSRLNVTTDESNPNPQNMKLEAGAKALGYQVEPVPRNVRGCNDCGFCNYGCPIGAKQGTLKNYLLDAYRAGTQILIQSEVKRILIERGQAVGVELRHTDASGQQHQVIIKAKRVVIAAGAIQTPALLLRSGLTNSNLGEHLHLHPTTVIYGVYDEPICGWSGVIISRAVKEFTNLDGRGYGVILETAPVHPGIGAMTMPWQNGYQHKAAMSQLRYLANTIIITRDREGGRVRLNKHGQPRIDYPLSDYDAQNMMVGVQEAMRIQQAAGAKEISAPFTMPYLYRPGQKPLDHFLEAVAQRGLHPNRFVLLSAHQMSSARMAGSARLGVLNPEGETYEVKNLYVADASALPTSVGVNPMITIMAMAQCIATSLKASLS